jgi:protein-S-isoprenylcysteine O-methyltransferase Ste14
MRLSCCRIKRMYASILLLSTLIYAALVGSTFAVAGTWRLPFFWAVFGTQFIVGIVASFLMDKDLIDERLRPGGKDEDPLAKVILSILLLACAWISAADVGHWHISHILLWLQVVALVIHAVGWTGFFFVMLRNKFFSSAIRLQMDRGQTVVTDGPYRWIRHPGYSFASVAFLSQGIALGSWLSIIPALLIVADLIHRTLLEEKILRQGLPGYNEYTEKVKYRWLPGIW